MTLGTLVVKFVSRLSPHARLVALCFSFVLPILAWCMVSYVPFVWHPQVFITNPGSVTASNPACG